MLRCLPRLKKQSLSLLSITVDFPLIKSALFSQKKQDAIKVP